MAIYRESRKRLPPYKMELKFEKYFLRPALIKDSNLLGKEHHNEESQTN